MAYEEDHALAQRVCRELGEGVRDGFAEIFLRYAPDLEGFAYSQLYWKDKQTVHDVLGAYWERLLDGRVLCRYDARASLQTYLTAVLKYQIRTVNKRMKRHKKRTIELTEAARALQSEAVNLDRFPGEPGSGTTMGERVLRRSPGSRLLSRDTQRLQREVIHEALLRLSKRKAVWGELAWFRLCGLTYGEIALVRWQRKSRGAPLEGKALEDAADAVKHRCIRKTPSPGCMLRFRELVAMLAKQRGLDPRDLWC
jgi:hypothetical protein